jgi:hypothetical protein
LPEEEDGDGETYQLTTETTVTLADSMSTSNVNIEEAQPPTTKTDAAIVSTSRPGTLSLTDDSETNPLLVTTATEEEASSSNIPSSERPSASSTEDGTDHTLSSALTSAAAGVDLLSPNNLTTGDLVESSSLPDTGIGPITTTP